MLRVLLVEDDQTITQALKQALGKAPGLSVVGTASSVAAAKSLIERGLSFEVGLIDIGLPDGRGTEVLRLLSTSHPQSTLLAFTQFDDADTVFTALRAGAVGYLLKTTPIERLLRAIADATAGGAPMSPSIARLVVGSFNERKSDADSTAALSNRESDVLKLLAAGKRYEEAAETLGVELSTVQTHVKSIYRKLHVNSKAQATAWAREHGLVPKQ